MSPLTRPGVGQSLNNQPAVMDEYADAIEAIRGLPAGLTRTEEYAALSSQAINAANAITNWEGPNLVSGPTLETVAGLFQEGTGSVKGVFSHASATGRLSYENGSLIPKPAGYNAVVLWLRWDIAVVYQVAQGPQGMAKIRVSEAADLGGTYVEVPFPQIPIQTWYRLTIPIPTLTGVQSVGVVQFFNYADATPQSTVWIDDIRFKQMTEAEVALQSATTVGVVNSPSYTPAVAELTGIPSDTKSVIDLRPNRQYVTGLSGVRDIREYGITAEDGSVDVSADLAYVLNNVPDGTTIRLAADAQYLCNGEMWFFNKKNITLDGNGATLFTTRRRGLSTSHGRDSFLYIGSGCQNWTIKNLNIVGYKLTNTLGSGLADLTGTPTVGGPGGTAKLLDAQNEEVGWPRPAGFWYSWYARDKDGYWRFRFKLSQSSGAVTNDCRILVTEAEPAGLGANLIDVTMTPTSANPNGDWYEYTYRPTEGQSRTRLRISVRKATAGVNTVTVHDAEAFGEVEYEGVYDNGTGIHVQEATNTTIENCVLEGHSTDGIQADSSTPTFLTIRHCVLRGNSRHGFSSERGEGITIEDCDILMCGYQSIDIEPGNPAYLVKQLVIRNVNIVGNELGSLVLQGGLQTSGVLVSNVIARKSKSPWLHISDALISNFITVPDPGADALDNIITSCTNTTFVGCAFGGNLRVFDGSDVNFIAPIIKAPLNTVYGLFPTLTGTRNRITDAVVEGHATIYNLRSDATTIFTTKDVLELPRQADPAAPADNIARLYTRDNGADKTQLVVRFPTGAIQVIATEP